MLDYKLRTLYKCIVKKEVVDGKKEKEKSCKEKKEKVKGNLLI